MLIKTRLQLLFAFLVIVFLSTGGLMIGALQDLEKAVTEGSTGRLRLIQSGQIRDQILSASAEVEDLARWNTEDRSRFFGMLESCKETIQKMRLGLTGENDPLKGTIESLSRPVTDFGRAVTRALRYLDEEGPASRRLDPRFGRHRPRHRRGRADAGPAPPPRLQAEDRRARAPRPPARVAPRAPPPARRAWSAPPRRARPAEPGTSP